MGAIPKGLLEKQELRRKETIDKVTKAIDELEEEGYLISVKLLAERTGLSRAVFSKPHVEEILKKKAIGKFKQVQKIDLAEKSIREKIIILEKESIKLNSKVNRLEEECKEKEKKLKKLKQDNLELTNEVELLRGKLFSVMKKATIQGVIFKDDELY